MRINLIEAIFIRPGIICENRLNFQNGLAAGIMNQLRGNGLQVFVF